MRVTMKLTAIILLFAFFGAISASDALIRVKRQFQRSQSQEDYEEFGFLFPGRQLPGTFDRNSNQRAISQTSTTAMNPSPVTNSRAVDACVRGCSVRTTNQYNPVCGSDGQFYTNRARLDCTIDCGANVRFDRIGTCRPANL